MKKLIISIIFVFFFIAFTSPFMFKDCHKEIISCEDIPIPPRSYDCVDQIVEVCD